MQLIVGLRNITMDKSMLKGAAAEGFRGIWAQFCLPLPVCLADGWLSFQSTPLFERLISALLHNQQNTIYICTYYHHKKIAWRGVRRKADECRWIHENLVFLTTPRVALVLMSLLYSLGQIVCCSKILYISCNFI
jgi:hypothetical protein